MISGLAGAGKFEAAGIEFGGVSRIRVCDFPCRRRRAGVGKWRSGSIAAPAPIDRGSRRSSPQKNSLVIWSPQTTGPYSGNYCSVSAFSGRCVLRPGETAVTCLAIVKLHIPSSTCQALVHKFHLKFPSSDCQALVHKFHLKFPRPLRKSVPRPVLPSMPHPRRQCPRYCPDRGSINASACFVGIMRHHQHKPFDGLARRFVCHAHPQMRKPSTTRTTRSSPATAVRLHHPQRPMASR